MVIDASANDVTLRQRLVATSPSGVESPMDSSDNANTESDRCSDTEFDTNITTMDSETANELIKTTEHMTHDAALEKLKEVGAKTPILPSEIGTDFSFKRKVVWPNAIGFLMLHICAAIGILLVIFGYTKFYTVLYTFMLMYGSGLGVTMGAHRHFSHRAFKAKTPLKIFLLWLHTLAGQNCLYVWVRDHRQHHKFSDTDADPHNANRGFFFSHCGWLMSRKHPKVIEYGKKIDMSDLEADKYVMFQKHHYKVLYTFFSLIFPTVVPIIFWGENPIVALFVAYFSRAVISLNGTWLVNSAAHLYGTRPFDKTIFPVESMVVAFLAVGEGWHNYHHAFPWDYRASELGSPFNVTAGLIDIFAKYGWIYDRREASVNMIKNRCIRIGDGSHHLYGNEEGQKSFKTLWNIWRHPSNPTFNSIYAPTTKVLKGDGYALIESELSKNELDEELLKKENAEFDKQNELIAKADVIENSDKIAKYIVDKSKADQLNEGDDESNNVNNNNECEAKIAQKHKKPKEKSKLNLNVDEAIFSKI